MLVSRGNRHCQAPIPDLDYCAGAHIPPAYAQQSHLFAYLFCASHHAAVRRLPQQSGQLESRSEQAQTWQAALAQRMPSVREGPVRPAPIPPGGRLGPSVGSLVWAERCPSGATGPQRAASCPRASHCPVPAGSRAAATLLAAVYVLITGSASAAPPLPSSSRSQLHGCAGACRASVPDQIRRRPCPSLGSHDGAALPCHAPSSRPFHPLPFCAFFLSALQRYHICNEHMMAKEVLVRGAPQRFCQQVSWPVCFKEQVVAVFPSGCAQAAMCPCDPD
jgi:hypothetical protein